MNKKHLNKSTLWKVVGAALGVSVLVGSVAATAVSCSHNESSKPTPPPNVNGTIQNNNNQDFMSSNSAYTTITTPQMIRSVLATTNGQSALQKAYAQYAVYEWFKNSNNALVQSTFQQQINEAQKSYNSKYDSFQKQGGQWQNKFQQQVLDPAGGSEQAWIYQQVSTNLMSQFTSLVMPSNFLQSYLSLQSGSTVTPLSGSSISLNTINEPSNVNGGFSVNVNASGTPTITWNTNGGVQTNNFVIAPSSSDSNTGANSINKGYADFINFAFNQWVKQTLPVLSPAVLYKNSANPNNSGLFNNNFFGTSLTSNGSYNFQYFTPSSGNMQVDSTTDLYNQFLNGLQNNFWNNNYVQASTGGAVDIPKNLTQDTSTKLVTNLSSAFTTYVPPFASAVAYKINNLIYGNGTGLGNALDANVPTTKSFFTGNADDSTQTIMGNFLIFQPSSGKITTPAGGIIFPYSYVNSISAFSNAFSSVIGTKDSIDVADSPFIMTRDEFGVHIIAIDRYYAMQQALIRLGSSATPAQKMQAIYTVMRNTVLWRAAQDIKGASNNLNLESTLQKWVSANIDSLVLSYLGYQLDPNSSTAFMPAGPNQQASFTNNLFGSQWQKTTDWQKTFTNSFSTGSGSNNNLLGLFNAINNINIGQSDKTYIDTVKSKIYGQQTKYNDAVDAQTWGSYALAGVLPYTRNPFTGNYDSLDAIVLNNLPILNTYNQANLTLSQLNGLIGSNNNFVLPYYLSNAVASNSLSALPAVKLWYAQYLYNENYANLLNNFLANVSPATSSSSYWSSNQFFANSGQTVIGQHSYVFVDNLLVNLAVQQAQQDSVMTNIVNNALNNAQLQDFYNFQSDQLLGYNANLAPFNPSAVTSLQNLNTYITYWLQNAINSQYNINAFTGLTNLYQAGNWTSYDQVQEIATMLTYQNFYENYISVPNASPNIANQPVQYLNFSNNSNFLKFLETLQWLVGWDATTKTYTFANLISQLNDMTKDNQIAYIAWQFQNSNKFNVYQNTNNINFANPTAPTTSNAPQGQAYGLTGTLSSYQSDVNQAINYDGLFKANPLYLTHLTPYSFQGAQNMTKAFGSGDNYFAYSWAGSSAASQPIETMAYNSSFVTSDFTHYFNVAPIGNNKTGSTGFLGFQSNASNSVVSSLPSSAYNSSIFGNNISNPQNNYVGALYQYGSAANLQQDISNSQSSSQLENYINVINECGFNFTAQTSQALTDALNGYSTQNGQQIPLTFAQRKSLILNDVMPSITNTYPQAFTPLTNAFLWNKQSSVSSTLFPSSTQGQSAIYNEYVVTEFSSADVNNLVTYFNGSNSIKALNTSLTSGFLRSNPQAFFDAIVLLAQNSNVQTLATQAVTTNEQSASNQITVYDNRVAQALGQQIVKNWDDFENSN